MTDEEKIKELEKQIEELQELIKELERKIAYYRDQRERVI